jgi:uncharacterized lipoprotein YddW (UPF0748 family)
MFSHPALTSRFVLRLLLAILAGTPNFTSFAQSNEFRGMWVNAWNTGLQNSSQVTTLVNQLRAGNFNAVIPQVRRRGDALYDSNFEPHATGTTPADFDALGDLIAKAHNTNAGPYIEVHAWLVTYHIKQGIALPPQPDHPLNLHPDWLLLDVTGTNFIGNEYTFDPGHPEVQRHTFNVAMDIVTNYNVDGLNFDYIRYSGNNEGYNPVTVARFNQRFGRTGQPSPSDALWKQFRRDQLTGLLRKIYLNVMAVKPHVKVSADTITWAPGPTSDAQWYSSSAAWNSVLQDWRGWMEEGILDLNVPMNYFRETTHPTDYDNWMNFAKDHQFNRHAVIGPGTYLNNISNAIVQMRETRLASPGGKYAAGVCGYDYNTPYLSGGGQFGAFHTFLTNSPNVHDPLSPALFQQPAPIPPMPWKVAPTTGHLMGTVHSGNFTNGLDGAVVTLTGPANRSQTNDATGFYGFVDLPPGNYTVQASFPGYAPVSSNVTVAVGLVATRNLPLVLQGPPAIVAHPVNVTNYVGTPAAFTVSANGTAPMACQWRKDEAPIPGATNLTHYLSVIAVGDAGEYDAVITNSLGSVTSGVAVLSVIVPAPNTRTVPLWNLAPGSRPYLNTDGSQRGLSFNPLNGNLLLMSRPSGVAGVYVLNSTNGADLHLLNPGSGVISGGTFPLNLIGVADDGAVFAGNLTVNGTTSAFRLYRWANDDSATVPTLAFSGDPVPGSGERWGDTLNVRGAGANTQVIIGSRSGTNVVIFTTTDGLTFVPNPIAISSGAGGIFGLGLAFGAGNTIWGKQTGSPLRQASFNLAAGAGTVMQSFNSPTVANTVGAIGVSTNLQLLGGVAIETPDNFQLYDLPASGAPGLVETNAFPTDNPNSNLTGSVDFGGDRVFALDSNNGILALQLLSPTPAEFVLIDRLPDGQVQLLWNGHPVFTYHLQVSSNLLFWSDLANVAGTNGVFQFTDATATNQLQRFYRTRN